MTNIQQIKRKRRERIHKKIRTKIKGTKEKPRLSVFRSNKYIYAQVIDDIGQQTLASAFEKELKNNKQTKTQKAKELGKLLAQRMKESNITTIVFDRGGYKYQGRVKALAEGLREGGIKF